MTKVTTYIKNWLKQQSENKKTILKEGKASGKKVQLNSLDNPEIQLKNSQQCNESEVLEEHLLNRKVSVHSENDKPCEVVSQRSALPNIATTDANDCDALPLQENKTKQASNKSKTENTTSNKLFTGAIKKAITTFMPSEFSGVDEIKREIKKEQSRIKDLNGEEKKLRSSVENLTKKQHKNTETEGLIAKKTSELKELKQQTEEANLGLQQLKKEKAQAVKQWEEFTGEVAKLIGNFRSFQQCKTDILPVHLSRFHVNTDYGPLVLKDVHLRLVDVSIIETNGKKSISIELDIPNATIDIPVEGAEPLTTNVKVQPVRIRFDGEISRHIAEYCQAPDAFNAGLKILSFGKTIAGLLLGKDKETPAEKIEANPKKLTGKKSKDNSSDNAGVKINPLPSCVSVDVGKVEVDCDHISDKQLKGLYVLFERKPSKIEPKILPALFQVPSILSINQFLFNACSNDKYREKSLQLKVEAKNFSVEAKCEKATDNTSIQKVEINTGFESLGLEGERFIPFISAFGKRMNIVLPEASTTFDNITSVLPDNVVEQGSICLKHGKINAGFSRNHQQPVKKGSEQWAPSDIEQINASVKELDIHAKGAVSLDGKLHHIELNKTHEAENNTDLVQVSLGKPGQKKCNNLRVSGHDQIISIGNKPLSIDGQFEITSSDYGTFKIKQSSDRQLQQVDGEQCPSVELHTKTPCNIAYGEHRVQLPSSISASVKKPDISIEISKNESQHKSELVARAKWNAINISGSGDCGYQKTHEDKSKTGKKIVVPVNGDMSLTPSSVTFRNKQFYDESIPDIFAEKAGLELNNIDIDGIAIENIALDCDKELNGHIKVQGVSLPFGSHKGNKLTLFSEKLPRMARFFLRNKSITAGFEGPVKAGKTNINSLGLVKVQLKADTGAGLVDKVTARLINVGITLFSRAFRRGLIYLKSDSDKVFVGSSISRSLRVFVSGKISTLLMQSLGMDKKGYIHLPSALQNYAGISMLPASVRETVDLQLKDVYQGNMDAAIRLVNQAEQSLSNPVSKPLGLYLIKQFPWSLFSQQQVDESSFLKKMIELTLGQDETLNLGISLYKAYHQNVDEQQARTIFQRCQALDKNLYPLGEMLLKASAFDARDVMALTCFSDALKRNPDDIEAHVMCSMLLNKKSKRSSKENAQLLEHYKSAACLGDIESYLTLKKLAETSEEAALVMVRVHLYYELNPGKLSFLQGKPEKTGLEKTQQEHFESLSTLLYRLVKSKEQGLADSAMNILLSRCRHADTILHKHSIELCDEKTQFMSRVRKKVMKEQSKWLTPEYCYEGAMNAMFCLNGQEQDLELANKLLSKIQTEHPKASFYLNMLEKI